jgi:hypothetical protein
MDNKLPEWYTEIIENDCETMTRIGICGTNLPAGISAQFFADVINERRKKSQLSQKTNTENTNSHEEFSHLFLAQETPEVILTYLIDIINKKKLTCIILMFSTFGDKEARIIADHINNKMLTIGLGFINCMITNEGASILTKALIDNNRIQHLLFDTGIDNTLIKQVKILTERNKNLPEIIKRSIPINFVLGLNSNNTPNKDYFLPKDVIDNIVYYIFSVNFYNYKPMTYIEKYLDKPYLIEDNLNKLSSWFKNIF